jgi:hypothetical protein
VPGVESDVLKKYSVKESKEYQVYGYSHEINLDLQFSGENTGNG